MSCQHEIATTAGTSTASSGSKSNGQEDSVRGPLGLLATISPTEGTKHYSVDHLGTPRLVCDRCAHVLARHDYYPFGQEATNAFQDTERMKFTGHERDLGLPNKTLDDLDYMHARYYSLNIGRFLSVDPVGGSVGSSQSWNRYSYVMGNPMNLIDPDGRYGKGEGFTDAEWDRFNRAQQEGATRMEGTAATLDKKASKLEKKAKKLRGKKREKKLKKARASRKIAANLRAGAAVLRSDGSDGRIANAVDRSAWLGLGHGADAAAAVDNNGPIVTVYIGHPAWATAGTPAQRAIGHESLHTVGLHHERGPNGAVAYQYGTDKQRRAFRAISGTAKAISNPDSIMDLVY